ncbi:DUF4190 domain-containing protein [Microbacterium sp. CIAB417]|uniref:DUF4190 domain-containing protein n=1 Tax=Microbacterium sp. CIAB417 TaxID=2860287 RepID=UPI001FADFA8D|nr:DUF4190 domain-containing protein [Microbacterium sp. CIAB417]
MNDHSLPGGDPSAVPPTPPPAPAAPQAPVPPYAASVQPSTPSSAQPDATAHAQPYGQSGPATPSGGQPYPGPSYPGQPNAGPPYAQPSSAQPYAVQPYAQPPSGHPHAVQTYSQPGAMQPYAQPAAPGVAYPAGGYPTAPYVPRPNSGLAIASLICGIAGLVLAAFLVPLIASVVAIITGHMGLNQIKRNPALGGKGLAITGLVLGYIGVAFLVLFVGIMLFSLLFVGGLGLLPLFWL